MAGVFVSYRRADSAAWAGRLSDHLSMRFGGDLVFQDVEDLAPGTDWQAAISDEIAATEAFLAVIGPQWLELSDDQGRHRIGLDDDVLRGEIQLALEQDRTVIPVLVGGAQMPPADELPTSISALAARQASALRDDRWSADVKELFETLRQLVLPTREDMSLRSAQSGLHDLQKQYFDALERDRDAAVALELAHEALRLLDQALPLYPEDPWLKVTRGYFRKNESMALRRLERDDEADKALAEAERVFGTMLTEDPEDAGAWNGRGSVAAIRGDYQEALEFVDRALEIDPTYDAARRDRERLLPNLIEAATTNAAPDRRSGSVDPGAFGGWWNHEGRAWRGPSFDFALEITGDGGYALSSASEHFSPGDLVLRIARSGVDQFAGEFLDAESGEWTGVIGVLSGEDRVDFDWAGREGRTHMYRREGTSD